MDLSFYRGVFEVKVIICDKCKGKFNVGKLLNRWLKKDVQESYFVCPHCKKEYRVLITNKIIRSIQRKMDIALSKNNMVHFNTLQRKFKKELDLFNVRSKFKKK